MKAGRLAAFALGVAGGGALMLGTPVAATDPPVPQDSGGRFGHQEHNQIASREQPQAGDVAPPEIGFRGCAYFEDARFGGRRGEAREGAYIEWLGAVWNDRISSVACAPGCRLIGYETINYGGARRNFAGAVADLGSTWGDRISALRVTCAAEAPTTPPHGHDETGH